MKQRLFFYTLLLLTGFCCQSCLFQEDDLFGEPSAVRSATAVTGVQEILQNVPNGWKLEYYVGTGYSLGGTTLLMRFADGHVDMAAGTGPSAYKPGTVVGSLYQVTAEQATMITFDTYNLLLHNYSTPLDANMSLEGDYEFIVMSASEDKVVLQGKRYGNIMEMTPVPKDIPWCIVLDDIDVIEQDAGGRAYRLEKDGKLQKLFLRNNGTFATFSAYDVATGAEEIVSYIYTEKGLRLYTGYDAGGTNVQNFEWDKKERRFVCVDADASGVVLVEYALDNRTPYETYVGSYEAAVSRVGEDARVVTENLFVTITPDVAGESYSLKGLVVIEDLKLSLDIPLLYDKTTGELILDSQVIGNYNNYYYFACVAGSGNYAHTELNMPARLRGGLVSVVDDRSPLKLHFVDKLSATDTSMLVWLYDSEEFSMSSAMGYWYYYTFISLTKKDPQN